MAMWLCVVPGDEALSLVVSWLISVDMVRPPALVLLAALSISQAQGLFWYTFSEFINADTLSGDAAAIARTTGPPKGYTPYERHNGTHLGEVHRH
jgi:hypothetical protein